MRKISTVIICSLLITSFIGIFSIQISVADPTTIYVNDDNTVGPWDGSEEHPYQHIQDAVNVSNQGDTIYVYNGAYSEQINVNKSVLLEGQNNTSTIVTGGFNVTRNSTTIQNFAITGGYAWDPDGDGSYGTHRAGIRTNSSSNTFYNNNIYDIIGGNGGDDEFLGGGAGGSGTGIYLNSSSTSEIIQNTIYSLHGGSGGGGGSGGPGGNCTGIYLNTSTGIDITQNTIDDLTGGDGGNADPGGNGGTSVGIFLETTTNTNITQNTITNITGGTGGDADHGGDGNLGAGIYFHSSNSNTLTNDTITNMDNGTGGTGGVTSGVDGMGVGFYGDDSDDNTILQCRVTFGYRGVTFSSSSDNLCYDNYFSNNTYNVYDDGVNTWNTVKTLGTNIIGGSYLGGNYWSNYTGVDGNVDGFGDTPYDISGGANQDTLPLMNQPPNTPNSPNPADNATGISVDADLSWSGGDPDSDTVTYDVYFGSSNPPSKETSNQTGISYNPGTMNHDTKYYWKIVAWDSNGATASGPVWNFTTKVNTPPDAPSSPDPPNNSTVIPVNSDLSWTGGDPDGDTVKYDVYFGTASSPPKVISNQSGNSYDTGTMNYNTTYYWKIVSWDDHDVSNVSPLWKFNTTSPSNNSPTFENLDPINGKTDVSVSLSILHVTILDHDGDSFNWTITTLPNIGNSSGNNATNGTKNCSIANLAYSTTYTWNVTAYDGVYWTNRTYSFTTVAYGGGGGGGGGGSSGGSENIIPVANASAGEPYQGYVNSEILFNGSKSYDPDGHITKWFWVFGDNTNGTGKTVRHIYSKSGTYTVTLTVTDNETATNTDTTTCVIKQQNRPPTKPIITGPISGTKNTMYTYTARSTDADNDTINYSFDWGDAVSQSSGFLPNATNYTVNHSWAAAGRYSVTVTVTDNQTKSSSNITVYIDALQTRGVGYLVDNDGDGVYDAFYSDVSKQTVTIQKKDDSYLIDSNGDGEWDYTYNATSGLIDFRKPRKTPGFEIIVIISAIALDMFWKRKRKNND